MKKRQDFSLSAWQRLTAVMGARAAEWKGNQHGQFSEIENNTRLKYACIWPDWIFWEDYHFVEWNLNTYSKTEWNTVTINPSHVNHNSDSYSICTLQSPISWHWLPLWWKSWLCICEDETSHNHTIKITTTSNEITKSQAHLTRHKEAHHTKHGVQLSYTNNTCNNHCGVTIQLLHNKERSVIISTISHVTKERYLSTFSTLIITLLMFSHLSIALSTANICLHLFPTAEHRCSVYTSVLLNHAIVFFYSNTPSRLTDVL